ncbi:hypothetical protein CDAR_269211 [Caerostris darwini]|uniref:Uncharacterized protein n=1 Tax=Caerostris darwini TaxID=1538125 RepID=A0AAV4NTR3_9ARAC|nr:hypothetical protein CDAR_269211 [Caerostris darwini]
MTALDGLPFRMTLDGLPSFCTSIELRKSLSARGFAHVSANIPAEKCEEVLKSKLVKYGLSLKEDIVSITTDKATVMKKVGKLIGANQQLCYAHGIQLGVIDVLYQKNKIKKIKKEQNNPNTVDIEASDSDFEESESDNEDNDNVIVEEDIAN